MCGWHYLRPWGWGLVSVLLGAGAVAESPLTETRSALAEWVQARQAISRTRADWTADKALLEQQAALLERELAGLREQAARLETNQTSLAERRESALALKPPYLEALATIQQRLGSLETGVRRLEPLFPPALRATVQPLLNRLPADPAAAHLPIVPRVLTVVTLLNEVDKFHGTLTVSEETRTGPDGREVAVEVLYAGLAQAWFVSKTGTFAGVGVPDASGWQWTSRNDAGPAIARTIRMYRNELPAAFVSLPVQLR